jgi:hypothetical protein
MQSRTAELSEQERTGQIEWFESLLEALEEGKVEDAKASVRGAIKMLEGER